MLNTVAFFFLITENTNIMFLTVTKDTNMTATRRNKHEEKQTFIRSLIFGASNQYLDLLYNCASSIWLRLVLYRQTRI